jgi:hypothetical protein
MPVKLGYIRSQPQSWAGKTELKRHFRSHLTRGSYEFDNVINQLKAEERIIDHAQRTGSAGPPTAGYRVIEDGVEG